MNKIVIKLESHCSERPWQCFVPSLCVFCVSYLLNKSISNQVSHFYFQICATGGPFGAPGWESCINYEKTATSSLGVLGKELGIKTSFW